MHQRLCCYTDAVTRTHFRMEFSLTHSKNISLLHFLYFPLNYPFPEIHSGTFENSLHKVNFGASHNPLWTV